MKKLKTAVVGLGRIGWQHHLPQVVAGDGYDAVGVVDPLPERRAEAHARFGVQAFAELDALFDGVPDLDLLVIASPTQFHEAQAVAAFRRGIDVFCDKPMAPDLAGADRMIAAMRQHGRKLMVFQPRRCDDDLASLRALLAEDLIGPVFMIKRACARYDRRNDWQAFKRYGGGILNNYGAHYIDQLLYVTGAPAARISCALRTIASLGDADDVVKAVIETESGVILDLDINIACATGMPTWQVLGRRGTAEPGEDEHGRLGWRVRYFRDSDLAEVRVQDGLAAEARRYGSGETIPWQETFRPYADHPGADFYTAMHDYYAGEAPPFVAIGETREVMRVLDACRAAAR